MADIVDPKTRSRMMSGIRGADTKPEMSVRRRLHAAGFRYSLHRKDLSGRPDLVLPRYNAVVFIHGCYWHRHKDCRLATMPSSNTDFWTKKFLANQDRDNRNISDLKSEGWRTALVWECGLKTPVKADAAVQRLIRWLVSAEESIEIAIEV